MRQYHQLRGEPGRFKIIARYRAYHGSTLGALSATGQAMRRIGYEPLAPGFLHVAPPDPYRDGIAEDDLEAYGQRCAADLERTILFELPETVAAVIMEPIITGGGILIPPDSYLPAVKALCERHGVLLICDEVICGFGRTGTWFGHERAGVRPDLVTMAKGITGAYFPLAATVVSDEIFAAFPADPADAGRLRHINTFGGHPAGCAVALETLAIMEEEGLLERSATARRRPAGAAAGRARRPSAGRRHARPRAADRDRAGRGPGDACAGRPRGHRRDRRGRPAARAAARPQRRHGGRARQRDRAGAAAVDDRRGRRPHRRRAGRGVRGASSKAVTDGDKIFAGGTVVTAEGSFRADVAVEGETIAAVGVDLPRDGAEVIDVSGARVMPGFIDGHTHLDMPFGGTMTADDWDTGTAAALAGGTTTIVDFSLQDVDGTLTEAVEEWQGKAESARIDFGLHVAITNLTEDVKRELPSLPALGVATVKIFMAYKGTPLYTEDDDLFEAMQIARECGLLVLVHAENGDAIAKLQEQALARGDTSPKWHGLTRPEAVEAEATNRAIRLAEVAGCPLLVVHVSCAASLEEIKRAHARGQAVYAETCPQYLVFSDAHLALPGFEGAKYVLSPPLRDASNQPALWNGLQRQDLHIFGSDHCSFNFRGQKELGKDDFTLIPNGAPGLEERRRCCGRTASARAA